MITINDTPEQFSPAYNPNVIVGTSTNQNQDNYKMQLVVYDATDLNAIEQIYVGNYPVNPSGYVVADLSRVVRDIITHDFTLGLTKTTSANNSIKRIQVTAQDYYGAVPSATGDIEQVASPSGVTTFSAVWNASLPYEDFAGYTESDYYLMKSNYTLNRYLTNAPITALKMATNQNGYVHVLLRNRDALNAFEDLIVKTTIKTYNSAGTLLGEYDIAPNHAADFNTLAGYHVIIPIGTYNIAQIAGGDITTISGSTPILTSSVAYYTVQVEDADANVSYPITVNIVDYCNSPQMFRLHWLNRKGGFDSFNFEKYHTQSINIQRTNYRKPYGSAPSGTWSYSVGDITNQNMVNTSKRMYRVVSNWVSDAEATWLEELMTSPIVYWEQSPTVKVPINITDSAYEVRYSHKDKVFNVELGFEVSHDYNSQTY